MISERVSICIYIYMIMYVLFPYINHIPSTSVWLYVAGLQGIGYCWPSLRCWGLRIKTNA